MAEERSELDVNPDELLAEVRTLREMVETMLLQLPDLTIEIVLSGLDWHSKDAQKRAHETQNDRWRDYAAVVYRMAAEIKDAAEVHMSERAEGAKLTTIQGVPLPPEEKRLRDLARYYQEHPDAPLDDEP